MAWTWKTAKFTAIVLAVTLPAYAVFVAMEARVHNKSVEAFLAGFERGGTLMQNECVKRGFAQWVVMERFEPHRMADTPGVKFEFYPVVNPPDIYPCPFGDYAPAPTFDPATDPHTDFDLLTVPAPTDEEAVPIKVE